MIQAAPPAPASLEAFPAPLEEALPSGVVLWLEPCRGPRREPFLAVALFFFVKAFVVQAAYEDRIVFIPKNTAFVREVCACASGGNGAEYSVMVSVEHTKYSRRGDCWH